MRGGPLVVIGDVLLDVDLEGSAERLTPDAPVPVVDCQRERHRAGGAGLAATLAARLTGRDVVMITALGDDRSGRRVRDLLASRVELVPLPMRGTTPSKIRVRAAGQSLVRLDTGDGRAADGPVGPRVATALERAGAVLVSDYGRGVTAHPEIRRLLAGMSGRTPIVWDPHPRGAAPLPRTRLVTPNRAEARAFAGDEPAAGDEGFAQAARDAATLVARWEVGGVAVTLGDRGALLSVGDGVPFVAPAPETGITDRADTCGAGDSFAAAAAHVLHGGGLVTEAVTEAVRYASAFVAAGGAGAVSGTETRPAAPEPPAAPAGGEPWEVVRRVRERGGRVVATGGCFDLLHAGHVSMLREARRLGDCLVVCINSDASVRALKGPDRPLVPVSDRARVLSALECVDAVAVFDELTPVELLERLRPDVWVKGADYSGGDLVEAGVVRRHGGEVVLLPYLDGRSTSRLVARVRETASTHGGETR
ncbi:D-glycero-beta-D-manno-heptose 1-phosphate adenylyltransferase [Actinoallomurus spadix]|uniref:D-glycero-beta-D-manno-heptose 1-phosphate adenylyltransferase n=1 Tax=Actinoallomurus spadix TaxID=79912 RepID=A0ABP3FYC1_9ACTN|nr:D-glycero-beta-D-manno-heptose 1-phosphate adenylyltransferase [Actinoallomurus spadix]MCO5986354.1 D-glycero-beta-D-manno-heptose 1-phosphate adenylyltransferase [Actinoallomurus spadix]